MAERIRCLGKTDRGLVRANNEDNYVTLERRGFFAVCDGLGGHAAGEVASRIAVETLQERIGEGDDEKRRQLSEAIEEANRKILFDQRKNPERVGMGTTLSALWLPEEGAGEGWIGHVGDSRIYRFRKGTLDQLTDDHSPIFRLYKEGALEKEELRFHPQKNLIERSLGLSMMVESDLYTVEVQAGDLYLLCSDGLTDCVSDEAIAEACSNTEWDELPDHLIELALDGGGYDNITVVLIAV